jgi:hypothetical protein
MIPYMGPVACHFCHPETEDRIGVTNAELISEFNSSVCPYWSMYQQFIMNRRDELKELEEAYPETDLSWYKAFFESHDELFPHYHRHQAAIIWQGNPVEKEL